MNIFETYLINIIFILFPFLIYLFYIAYNQNISKKENKLFLELTIFSALYISIKYGHIIGHSQTILIFNIPLLIAYLMNRNISSIIISVIIISFYYVDFAFNLPMLIIEYSIIYLLYLFILKNKKRKWLFINIFIISKMILVVLQLKNTGIISQLTKEQLGQLTIWIGLFYFSALLIIYFVKKGEDIIKYHMNVKKLEESKQIQVSLFKITHEIKNPIAVCKGYLEMFDINNSEHSRQYIPIIKSEIERTLHLLVDFLSVDKYKIEKDILDINLLMEEVIYNFKPLMKDKNISLDCNFDEEELFIEADYNRLSQVLINMIKNSVEAISENGLITINISNKKDHIIINIKDDGIGIENISKIKEPFFTTKKNGTGLGVSLSNDIVKAHNGTIKYQSKLNQGTLVTITLPKNKETN
ncbi:MAG: ATP-binding protein [Bacilli bacterium]